MKKRYILMTITLILIVLFASCNSTDQEIDTKSLTLADTIAETKTVIADTNTELQTEAETLAEPEMICQNDEYTISVVDGKYYIDFWGGNKLPAENGAQVGFLSFDSVGQMKNAFMNNQLNDLHKKVLRTALCDPITKKIQICDLNNLYEAKLPENVKVSFIEMVKDGYYTHFQSETISTGVTRVVSKYEYDQTFEEQFGFYGGDNVLIKEQREGVFEGVSCQVIEYEYPNIESANRDILFDYQTGEAILHIRVRYLLKSPASHTERESDTLPFRIYMMGESHGEYFYSTIYEMNEPVTLSFLTSFGITPYVENAETPIPLDTVAQEVEVK